MLLIFILTVGAVLSCFCPWWIIAPVCFIGCWWLSRRPSRAFWLSAGAGAALWAGYTAYLLVTGGAGLAAQMAGIFTGGTPVFAGTAGAALMLATAAAVAAVVSGFSGLAGFRLKQLVGKQHENIL